jgi:SH3 domain protein
MAMANTAARGRAALAVGAVWVLLISAAAQPASAEKAWVRDEVRINLRTGPGTQYRIVGVLKTGDDVQILQRAEDWTKVRLGEGKDGWIPEGYLQAQPPAAVRVDRFQAQVAELQAKLEETDAEAARLREENSQIGGRDGEQRDEIERLTLENYELRAGARWPEWITGASILVVGMMVGALLHRNATRRPSTRIRI